MSAITNPAPAPQQPAGTPPEPVAGRTPGSGGPWKVLTGLVLLGACGWGAYEIWLRPKAATPVAGVPAVRTAKAVAGSLVRSVRIAGQTSARSFVNVTAPILRGPESGALILIKMAKSGGLVRKGELLAEIDAQSVKDHIDDLNDTVEAAEADVKKRGAEQAIEWVNLEQTLKVAKSNWEKAKLEAGAAETKTPIDQELLKLAAEEAEATYREIEKDLGNKKIAHQAELKTLQLTVQRHRSHMGRHATDLKKFTVHASMDGLVVMQSIVRGGEMTQVQLGDQIAPGQPFMKLVNIRSMQVEANVNQTESSQFRIGQEAKIGLDAFPGVKLTGHIYSIGALAVGGYRQNFFIRNIPIRVSIDSFDASLIPDLSAHCDVKVGEAKGSVLIPMDAVVKENGRSWVEVRAGTGFQRRAVEAGLSDGLQVAVVSGLEAGDEVRVH